jgi:hypothetical protein
MRPGPLQTKTLRRVAPASVLIALLLTAAALEEPWKLERPAPVVKLTPERIEKSETLACAQCHAAVVAEWAESAHAVSWQDHEYREQLSGHEAARGLLRLPRAQALVPAEGSGPPSRRRARSCASTA